jgi:dihydroorotase
VYRNKGQKSLSDHFLDSPKYIMKKFTIIKSLKAILPEKENPEICDILINNSTGIIEKIGTEIQVESAEVIKEYEGMLAMPGFIDPHVHFRVPGKPESEDWKTGSLAALSAGITTVFDMPNTNPPTVNQNGLKLKLDEIEKNSMINYGIFGGLTTDNLDFLLENKQINAIKVYLASTTGDMLIKDLQNINLGRSKKVICFHAEDENIIEKNTLEFGDLKNPIDHSIIRSEEAAVNSVRDVIRLQKKSGGKFHIAHVSSYDEIKELLDTELSFESAPHHIFCCTDNYQEGGFLWKCNPPLRQRSTMKKMQQALYDEKIPMIATDHAPHPFESKSFQTGKIPASGIPSIEVGTHFILNEAASGKISFLYAAKILSTNAAKRFSIDRRGEIREGNFADIAIIDLKQKWIFSKNNIYSKCGWSPFTNTEFTVKVLATFVNGFHYQTKDLKKYLTKTRNHNIYQV